MRGVHRQIRYHYLAFIKYDFRASVTVFFVALPLCLGIALASEAPIASGLIAGIVGGLVVPLISKSALSVSGPAAGLTAICAAAIGESPNIAAFFLSVAVAGILQILLGAFRLGGFTHFIPSAVIRGMLTAIGIILISKQIPPLLGYDQPDFWANEFFNLITLKPVFGSRFLERTHEGAMLLSALSFGVMWLWNRHVAHRIPIVPTLFVVVLIGSCVAQLLGVLHPHLALLPQHYVHIPGDAWEQVLQIPDFASGFSNAQVWKNAVILCFVATLETLLSIVAVDKMDPQHRITPQNRELIAQGISNMLSGLLGGLPITSVIVRSAANIEAKARTRLSAFGHGVWLLLAIVTAAPLLNQIPYCVLAVILMRTGYSLARPSLALAVYRQGREQFLPYVVTVTAILFTDLLIGVAIGIGYAIYFLIKHTYRAGYHVSYSSSEGNTLVRIDLALNVSFLNKKRIVELLDSLPEYSKVLIVGTHSVYIDHDILEMFHDFKTKAKYKHIELTLVDIPAVESASLH